MSVISTASNSIIATIEVGTPLGMAFAPNGKTAYLTECCANYVFVLNTKTKKFTVPIEVLSGPSALAVTPNGKFLYVVEQENNCSAAVTVISTATKQIVTNIDLGLPSCALAGAIAISPDGSTVYVSYSNPLHEQDPTGIQVIDTASGMIVNSIYVPDAPVSATVSPDGQWLYVAQNGSTSVAVIDTSTQTITNNIQVGLMPLDVAFTPDGAFAYVAFGAGFSVEVIDTTTQTSSDGIYLGDNFYPISVAVMGTHWPIVFGYSLKVRQGV
jgi:YVTN family beta-propeller protein